MCLAKVYANFRLQLYIFFYSYEGEYPVTEPCISQCIMCNDTMLIQCFCTFLAVYVKLLLSFSQLEDHDCLKLCADQINDTIQSDWETLS